MRREGYGALVVLGLGLGAVVVLWHAAPPLILGLALAAALERPVVWVRRVLGGSRFLAATVTLGALVIGMAVIAVWVGVQLVHELGVVRTHAPDIARAARGLGEEFLARLGGPDLSRLFGLARDERGTLTRMASGAAVRILHALSRVPTFFGTLFLSVVVAYVALLEGPLSRRFESLGASDLGHLAWVTLGTAIAAAWRLVSAELLLASYTATVSALLFALLGASVPVLLGVVAGLCDLVPYAGPAILYVPWALVLITTGQTLPGVEVLVGWALLVGSRAVFELRWVGRGVGLSPLWVLISFYLGGRLGGLPGLFLGPVVACAVWGVLASQGGWPGGGGSSESTASAERGDATWRNRVPSEAQRGRGLRTGAVVWLSRGGMPGGDPRNGHSVWRFLAPRGRWGGRRSMW